MGTATHQPVTHCCVCLNGYGLLVPSVTSVAGYQLCEPHAVFWGQVEPPEAPHREPTLREMIAVVTRQHPKKGQPL